MEDLILRKDLELGRMLRRLKVSPTFYGFRWITLLMTQEWDLPDVLRLWFACSDEPLDQPALMSLLMTCDQPLDDL